MNRRNVLAALSCAAVLGASEWLRPREKLVLMPEGKKLADIVPTRVGGWLVGEGGDIVIPRTEGSLASRLYSDQLARLYKDPNEVLPDIMVLIAYGGAQSDVLQLHRPEVCYPAIGFQIIDRNFQDIPLPSGSAVPAVGLTARGGERVEDILYWTRLGNALPRTAGEQRSDRLMAAMQGYVGDGVLVRASSVRTDGTSRIPQLTRFLEALVASLDASGRKALLGNEIKV